ncbi:Oligosaccharyl transferase STT3 subunit [Aureococcus anophagefferens]|nr:Oligosaccharyl transferase STT3 subunit [Aureococcus anophagefferens]
MASAAGYVGGLLRLVLTGFACHNAYDIRMSAIRTYGLVIHEFDPWFNMRATQYLADNGPKAFFTWFDYRSWYPLGRPVGTTIYPGMQLASVAIWRVLNELIGYEMSLNDVCVYVPVWFGVAATLLLGALTYECSRSANAAVASMLVMAVIPAHLMRSVGGGYDNESVAMTAMCLVFLLWVRSLRNDASWALGAAAGVAYVNMAASWGGYVFVGNMVAVHAFALVLLGRFGDRLHRAYSLFYVVGTFGATPIYAAVAGAGFAVILALFSTGFFGPISSRVRGLFVKHTRTGNPLVDSVAEHQPASASAYWHYLHYTAYGAPVGLVVVLVAGAFDAKTFIALYAVAAYFFANKMVRLIIFLGPVASALTGVFLGATVDWTAPLLLEALLGAPETAKKAKVDDKKAKKSKGKKADDDDAPRRFSGLDAFRAAAEPLVALGKAPKFRVARTVLAAAALAAAVHYYKQFSDYAWSLAEGMSQPSIMFRAHLRNGTPVMVDDYREAYWWLRDNTPEDARVMAWWDYGYQIAGIANRTTIADGNTWNHEHIATLGRCLTSPEKSAHKIVRHLADYVLIWTGGGGDDLAKSPHMARIGNSVYRDICPDDPTCRSFGFLDRQGTPTAMMAESLLFKLHSHNQRPGVAADPNLFREVYTSRFNKVRIFKVMKVSKKSKDSRTSTRSDGHADEYVAAYMARMEGRAPAEGGGYKPPKYFEIADDYDEDDYVEDDGVAPLEEFDAEADAAAAADYAARAAEAQAADWKAWSNNEDTTRMWSLISSGRYDELAAWIQASPPVVQMRAQDGRGPLWWAFEYDRPDMVQLLVDGGADPEATDSLGMTPKEMQA